MTVDIQPLELGHLRELVRLHADSGPEYSRYFQPFAFDVATLRALLAGKQRDLYYVLLAGPCVAGFYMLRGFDLGYSTPAYGVWIAPNYSGHGLARRTLEHAVDVCASLGCRELMLKVHPDNRRAKTIYERFGFQPAGVDPNNANLIYRLAVESHRSTVPRADTRSLTGDRN